MRAAPDRDEHHEHRDVGGHRDPQRETAHAHPGILP
jgi:hypothetical protein